MFQIVLGLITVKAQDNFYYVKDNKSSFIQEFESYDDAYDFYRDNLDEYNNLILSDDNRVIHMEYGTVEFNTDEGCSLTIEYHSDYRKADDYINGCYGADAAYLDTSRDGERVYFKLSGDIGYTSIDNVTLHPYEELDVSLSVYTIKDEKLFHNIKTQLKEDFFSYTLAYDDAPSFMENDKYYYSYDGHYFYDDFYLMIDDYKNESYDNAINDAYYSYFQYLPYRSLSNYSSTDAQNYFDSIGINKRLKHYTDFNSDGAADEVNRSQMYGQLGNFFVYQNVYGANAMMLLSSAINESSHGKTAQSYIRNNLYMAAAYESDVEREANRFNSIEDSIYSHAKYFISSMYSNHLKDTYTGTFYGNKLSGINVNYSLDPYYGERSAAAYYDLDNTLGRKDYNAYCLGIIQNKDRLRFYKDPDLDDLYFAIDDVQELSFVVLERNEVSCKVSIDASFNDQYLYDFEKSTAYISIDNFDLFINDSEIKDYDLNELEYDFDGGSFHGFDSLNIKYKNLEDLKELKPKKDGFEFIGYDESMKATYRQIESIELIGKFKTQTLYQPIDLSDVKLKINYADGSETIPLNSDMVSAYDNTIADKQTINISYCGISIDEEILFSEELYNNNLKITEAINSKDYETVKSLIAKSKYPFTFADIRTIDYDLMHKNQRNYVIKDETEKYNLSISGLDLSLADKTAFIFVQDTYYVIVNDINIQDEEKIYDLAKGYGFEKEEGIDISFMFNYQNIELDGPAIVQLNLKDKQNNKVYTVYHLDKDDDIIKCRTTQSDNYIQFMIEETGPYLVLSMPSVNEYDIEDNTEDLSYENMGFDNHQINFALMALLALTLFGIIGIIVYYILFNKKEREWRDFKKSLLKEDTVPEEKQKN